MFKMVVKKGVLFRRIDIDEVGTVQLLAVVLKTTRGEGTHVKTKVGL